MKKLMTMLAAVGLSFGLFAETTFPNGTSFETNAEGDNTVALLNAKETGASWAASADASATLTVTKYTTAGQTPLTEDDRPKQFKTASQNNFLEIKSAFDKPFVRTLDTALTKGDAGYYIDTLVRFTLADDKIEVSDDSAKLAVYVKAIDAEGNEDGQTNLVVVANKMASDGSVVETHFDCRCDADVADGKWHRLTVKAIDDMTNGSQAPGFVVFVDGSIVSADEQPMAKTVKTEVSTWATAYQLFPSLDQNSAEITGLAVAGQGGVDDISFTQAVPFDAARDYGTLTVNFTGDAEKMASFKVTAGSVDYDATAAQLEAGSMVIPLQGDLPKTINIAWTAKPGYKSGAEMGLAVDDKGVVTVTPGTVKGLVAKFEEEYDNLQDAVTAANTSATNGTLTLLADIDGDIEINNESETPATITIDLNGKTVTAADTAAIIADTDIVIVGAGEVNKSTDGEIAVLSYADAITINSSATFNGTVATDATIADCTAKFDVASNSDGEACALTPAEGKVWRKVDSDQYWQLTEKTTTDITDDMISEITATYGTAVADVEVKDGGKTLIKDVDYTVAFTVEAGTYTATTPAGTEVTATVTGMGDYSGSAKKKFTVAQATVAVPTPVLDLVYDGTEQTGVVDGDFYSLTDNKATDAGDYTAVATLNDTTNYKWADTTFDGNINWSIAKAAATIAVSGLNAEYDYQETFPTATITTDPAGLVTVSTWTNSVGIVVLAPAETADTYGLFVVLNANDGIAKNYTAEEATAAIAMKAKQTIPYTPGVGGGSVTPTGTPGVYIVAGDESSHSVNIVGGLKDTDTIIVQDAETANIIGVPESQIKVVLDSVEVDKTAFIGGDEKGYSLELNPETTTPEISDVEETADLDIAAGKIACSGIKGLFYSLVKSDEVAAVKTQEKCIVRAQCQQTGDAVELQDETEKGAKAFYLIKVGKAPMELLDD